MIFRSLFPHTSLPSSPIFFDDHALVGASLLTAVAFVDIFSRTDFSKLWSHDDLLLVSQYFLFLPFE